MSNELERMLQQVKFTIETGPQDVAIAIIQDMLRAAVGTAAENKANSDRFLYCVEHMHPYVTTRGWVFAGALKPRSDFDWMALGEQRNLAFINAVDEARQGT